MEKVIKDGKVAVLVSHGWGAGFHTWGAPIEAIFDPTLVELIEKQQIEEATTYAQKAYPTAFLGGIADLAVEWIPEGRKFRIAEYDGKEWVEYEDDIEWVTA